MFGTWKTLGLTMILSIYLVACSSGSGSGCTDNCGQGQGPEPTPDDSELIKNKPPVPPNIQNPDPVFNANPSDPVGAATPTNPTPNGIADIANVSVDNAVVGDWTTLVETSEAAFVFNADQTCEWAAVNYQNNILKSTCKWGVLNQSNEKVLLIEEVDKSWAWYRYEQVSENDFRIIGGPLGVNSWLFSRAVAGTVTGQLPGRWFIGIWDFQVSLDYRQEWLIDVGGQLQVNTIRKEHFETGVGIIPEQIIAQSVGQWSISADAKNFTFQLDQDPVMDGQIATGAPVSGTYALNSMTRNSFKLTGAGQILWDIWKRRNIYLFRPDPYAGQYTGSSTSITIANQGNSNYSVDVLYEGGINKWNGHLVQDSLIVDLPEGLHFLGQTTMRIEREFNGIVIADGTPTITAYLPGILNKSSETKLPDPPTIVGGAWYYQNKYSAYAKEYAFLSDGSYQMREGPVYDYGKYSISADNTLLTIDPVCAAPFSYPYALVENQMVLGIKSAAYDQYLFETYHYEPLSIETSDLRTAQFNSQRAIEAEKSLAKFALGDINPNYQSIPAVVTPTGTVFIGPDPNPGEVYPNAKVFTELEVYTWIQPILWCAAGSVLACDFGVFQFLPNGRVVYYSDTKWGIAEFTGNPLHADFFAWGAYTIEGDKIIVGSGAPIEFVNGRKQIRYGEFCYSGLE